MEEPRRDDADKTLVQTSVRDFQVCEDTTKALATPISEPTNAERVIRFRASDDTLDRYSEVILQDGWDLADFIKNPVVMAFHNYQSWPIGKAVGVGVVNDALHIDAEFDPPEVDEDADLVFKKIKHGTVRAGSVGFIPQRWVEPGVAEKGIDTAELFDTYPQARRIYVTQSLLEWTICPLPANPNALVASLREQAGRRFGAEPMIAAKGSDATTAAHAQRVGLLLRMDEMLRRIDN